MCFLEFTEKLTLEVGRLLISGQNLFLQDALP